MKGSTDVVKGHIEEAAGALVGNDKLRTKGQKDQSVGHAKQAVEKSVRPAMETAQKSTKAIVNLAKKND